MPSPAEKEEEESELQSSEFISSVRKQPKISSVERRKAFHRRLLEFANTHPEVTQMHLRRERDRDRDRGFRVQGELVDVLLHGNQVRSKEECSCR